MHMLFSISHVRETISHHLRCTIQTRDQAWGIEMFLSQREIAEFL
jgi:hypothetical protein